MIASCGALLALAILTAADEPSSHPLRTAVASVSDEAGDAFHNRARTAVHDVLATREFADLHLDPYAVWRRISEWIGGLFEGLARALGNLHDSIPWLYWTIVSWMVLTLVAILAHLIYTLVTLISGTKRGDPAAQGRHKIAGELLGIQDLDFDKVYAEARRLLAGGEWAAATKYFYVAAILWLDREGAIVFKRSKTNCDYVAELGRGAGVPALAGRVEVPIAGRGTPIQAPPKGGTPAQDFRRLTELFEPIVYGGRQPTNSNMDDISNIVESLLHDPAVAGPR